MFVPTSSLFFAAALIQISGVASPRDAGGLLDRYTANADQATSWRLSCKSTQNYHLFDDPNRVDLRYRASDVYSDGERVAWSRRQWGGAVGTRMCLPEEKASYHSIVWDGQAFSNYRTKSKNAKGVIFVDPHPNPRDVKSLRCLHVAAPLLGCYPNAYARIDSILRDARHVSLREHAEPVNGVDCFVIDAKTKYGDYTLWIDPEHGFNVAKAQIHASQEQKHWYLDNPVRGNWNSMIEISQFREFKGMWVAIEGTVDQFFDLPQGGSYTSKSRVEVTELSLDPDHESLGSFAHGDVVDGTWGWVAPHDQIKCIWQQGVFRPMFDHDAVRRIDDTVATILAEQKGVSPADLTDASRPSPSAAGPRVDLTLSTQPRDGTSLAEGEADSLTPQVQGDVKTKNRRAPYPHCGLYCVYSMMVMLGQQVDFQDLVKPQYLGSHEGSSLLELRQAALDLGFRAEPVGRLSASGLSHCPYPAILHVRLYPESPKYDHYELFLGVEQGKAKLFNPPQAPRLVSFADLATRWDASALFISRAPIETDLILAADRQHLLWYSMIGLLVILAGHIGRRVWLSLSPPITRRWALGLTVGQVSALALAAVLCAGAYHLFSEGGLLANAVATQALQKGYAGTFIPKVREETVNRLLGTGTVFIDARLAADYKNGHLDGAISLPVNADDTLWKETLARIPQGRPIITYCQSAGCKYAEKVSLRLIEEGYSDISIYRGGWSDWTDKKEAAGGSR